MTASRPLRILVVTRSYPAPGDLYQYPFVHRRVLAYIAAGHEVMVFRPADQPQLTSHEYEGVTCHSGNARALSQFARDRRPQVIAAHGFTEQMHQALADTDPSIPVRAWLHGSEIPGFFRAKALAIEDSGERARALEAVRERCNFWGRFLEAKPSNFKLVFVSRSAVDLAREDWGARLAAGDFAVIPNPIDTDLFRHRPKSAEDRFGVLMIRPFDSRTYGNDLAVEAIVRLSHREGADRLRFTIIGDGPLYDATVGPVRRLPNVDLRRRFLSQAEIVEQHSRHGMFLVPTRLDTQGVSRDEAMSSGLVPVTSKVSAVPEFVDETCAGLAGAEDAAGLADRLWEMAEQPALFLDRSKNAARRIRAQSGHALVIPQELRLLEEAVAGRGAGRS